ncbi:MAG: cytochrome c3 family protein [Myxococcales bacterium]|nr:cytochrome c3 family protein [Myxococcales bacterium]
MRRALLCLAALWPAAAGAQALSPGPLASAHADIDGDDGCLKCHQVGKGVAEAKCLDCHRALDARIRAGKGLHGRALKGRDCTQCHKDHLGRGASLVRWPGGTPERFKHNATGYPLEGAHADAKCRECHAQTRITDPAARKIEGTWLGLPTTCAECHRSEDPHDGEFAGRACTECHGQARWKQLVGFDHDRTQFPLVGEHRTVACDDCHRERRFTDTTSTCNGCHQTPHPEATKFGPDCAGCHTSAGWANIIYPLARHRQFPLKFGHAIKDCQKCHGEQGNTAPRSDCNGCHKDVHSGRFGNRCQTCHDTVDWHRIQRSAFDHDKTDFPLRGQHVSVRCEDCHKNGRLEKLPHEKCLDCHADPHRGEVGTKCEDCHVVQGFRPSTYGLARHTGFKLTGAHAATGCAECHKKEDVWRFQKGVVECHECHEDRHAGQFGERGCATCHVDTRWQPAERFEHAAVFALEGRHAETPCAHCHADEKYAGVPRQCGGCHGAPHLGQFTATAPAHDCTECHTPAGWKGGYDHDRVWPLAGAHAKAECGECHKEVTLADGRATVRWRLGFRDCARCHTSPHTGGTP